MVLRLCFFSSVIRVVAFCYDLFADLRLNVGIDAMMKFCHLSIKIMGCLVLNLLF